MNFDQSGKSKKFKKNQVTDIRLTTVKRIKEERQISASFKMSTVRLPHDRCGYLMKQSPAWLKSWQSRYVILKDRKLKYFKSNQEKDLKVP